MLLVLINSNSIHQHRDYRHIHIYDDSVSVVKCEKNVNCPSVTIWRNIYSNLLQLYGVGITFHKNSELRTQNSEFYLTTLRKHRGHRFINASRFSNGWYWNKAGEYSLTKLTKKYTHHCLNKETMPYLVSVVLSGVPLRHRAAIIGPLQQYNLKEKETDKGGVHYSDNDGN